MEERFASLERQVRTLSDAVASLERRLAAVETSPAPVPGNGLPDAARPVAAAVAAPAAPGDLSVVTVLALVGRICLVLGGAYLLRALTDAGKLPRVGGTPIGQHDRRPAAADP